MVDRVGVTLTPAPVTTQNGALVNAVPKLMEHEVAAEKVTRPAKSLDPVSRAKPVHALAVGGEFAESPAKCLACTDKNGSDVLPRAAALAFDGKIPQLVWNPELLLNDKVPKEFVNPF